MAPTVLNACLVLSIWATTAAVHSANGRINIHRSDFPNAFVFGTSSSAYQYEGAAAEDGKGPSIWDTFTHDEGNIADGGTGDVAVDEYHRYKEDVHLMSEMGMDAYRFSISWPRLIPKGRGSINPKGLEYYNNLIDELLDHGIQPYVTLYHFDLPQSLEDEYGGWVSPQIVEDFVAYAEVCFREFGDRVKHWITFNEPNMIAPLGYDAAILAPKRCSLPPGRCRAGNSTTEPYIVAHHILLSHAATVKLYRDKYQTKQNESIGIVVYGGWFRTLTNTTEDIAATQRAIDFMIGWFIDPLVFGDYPKVMREIVGSRLPAFTEKQTEELRQSFDFLGFNHYTTFYAANIPKSHTNSQERRYETDVSVYVTGRLTPDNQFNLFIQQYNDANSVNDVTAERDGIPIGKLSKILGFGSVPSGIQEILEYIKQRYHNPPVLVTENGICEGYPDANNDSIPLAEVLEDTERIEYHRDYLQYLVAAIRNGSDTRGYFVWTLLDDFEYVMGYTARFGLHYVDFNDNLKRYPKLSARWFRSLLLQQKYDFLLINSSLSRRSASH
eukprot:Gb_13348 [translate_table: standard]